MLLGWQAVSCLQLWALLEQPPMLKLQAVDLAWQTLPRCWTSCCYLRSQRVALLLSWF